MKDVLFKEYKFTKTIENSEILKENLNSLKSHGKLYLLDIFSDKMYCVSI